MVQTDKQTDRQTTDDKIIRLVRITYRINKSKKTHSEYVIKVK